MAGLVMVQGSLVILILDDIQSTDVLLFSHLSRYPASDWLTDVVRSGRWSLRALCKNEGEAAIKSYFRLLMLHVPKTNYFTIRQIIPCLLLSDRQAVLLYTDHDFSMFWVPGLLCPVWFLRLGGNTRSQHAVTCYVVI